MSTRIKEWECPEVFERFLNWLDAGREQAGRKYDAIHRGGEQRNIIHPDQIRLR